MYIIVGLGNPTPQYEGTRHNVGFDVIDAIADKYNITMDIRKHRAFLWERYCCRTESYFGKTADIYEFKRRECEKSCRLF